MSFLLLLNFVVFVVVAVCNNIGVLVITVVFVDVICCCFGRNCHLCCFCYCRGDGFLCLLLLLLSLLKYEKEEIMNVTYPFLKV